MDKKIHLYLGIGFSEKGINSIIASGHLSDTRVLDDPSCTAFSTAIQMFIVGLEEIRNKKWSLLLQEKGLMIAIFEKKDLWNYFIKEKEDFRKSINNFEEIAQKNSGEIIKTVTLLKKKLEEQSLSNLERINKKFFNRHKKYDDGQKAEKAIINAFFWVLEQLKKRKESQLTLYYFAES